MVLSRKFCSIVCLLFTCATGCTEADLDRWNQSTQWWRGGATNTNEEWTIECGHYEGADRRLVADRMARVLRKVPELDADRVQVKHGPMKSRIFYGVYRLKYVEAQSDRESGLEGDVTIRLSEAIKRDLKLIKQLAWGEQHPFLTASAIRKPNPDVGPSEWDLRNATGVYTLNVGVTYNTPTMKNYKQAAIEWVRDLRNRGYEAYYYHAPDKPKTSICVGSFGEDTVQIEKWVDQNNKVRVRKIISPDVELLRSKEEFRFNLENGAKIFRSSRDPKTGAMARMPNKSFLVKIPKNDEASD